jgi:hypothetical protein
MPDIRCYEPGLHGPLQSIHVAAATDRLIFPHVDSCLAIAFLLANGQMVGGHVPLQMDAAANLDAGGNADRIIVNMLRLVRFECGGAAINKLITLGDASMPFAPQVDYNLVNLANRANAAQGHLHLDSGAIAGGVDLYIDGPNQRVQALTTNGANMRYNQTFAVAIATNGTVNI